MIRDSLDNICAEQITPGLLLTATCLAGHCELQASDELISQYPYSSKMRADFLSNALNAPGPLPKMYLCSALSGSRGSPVTSRRPLHITAVVSTPANDIKSERGDVYGDYSTATLCQECLKNQQVDQAGSDHDDVAAGSYDGATSDMERNGGGLDHRCCDNAHAIWQREQYLLWDRDVFSEGAIPARLRTRDPERVHDVAEVHIVV